MTLLQWELILLLATLAYIFYYFSSKFYNIFAWIYKFFPKSRKRTIEKKITTIDIDDETSTQPKQYQESWNVLSIDDKNRIWDLLKKIRLNISLQEFDIAKNLIVEWLSIDKFDIEINLELASIYLFEKEYHKAEYIYKDLLLVHSDHFLTLKKLWYVLALQEKYDLALEVYKKAHEIDSQDQEVLNMLAHLCYHKELFFDGIDYIKAFLKSSPRDVENLILLWACYRAIWEYNNSLETYKKVIEIQPYNEPVKQEIEDLLTFTQKVDQ